jgi:hypothetical protein
MFKMKNLKIGIMLVAGVLFILNIGCEGTDDTTDNDTGTLSVSLSDAPFPLDVVDSAIVTIDSVVIRRHDDEEISSPFLTLTREQRSYNLLDLRNGVTASLTELEVPVGSYDLVRLYVHSARLVLTDGRDFDVFVPSGEQTGIKIFIDPVIEIVGGLTAELLLDFDVSKSFKLQGSLDTPAGVQGFIFSPVLRASNLSYAGRLEGMVSDGTNPLGEAQVWIEVSDTVLTSTFSEDNSENAGEYTFLGLPAGDYTAKATLSEYDTAASNITITAGNITFQDFLLTER